MVEVFYVGRWNKEKGDSNIIGIAGYYKHDNNAGRMQWAQRAGKRRDTCVSNG